MKTLPVLSRFCAVVACLACLHFGEVAARGALTLGPAQAVQASGSDLLVPGYAVPTYADWDNDGRMDLIVGEGGSGHEGYVRVYLNTGTAAAPQFAGYSHATTAAGPWVTYIGNECGTCGCLGTFPRVVYWDPDGKKDLLIGQPDGEVAVFLNVGTDASPLFDSGSLVTVGPSGSKVNVDVGLRATPTLADWDNDGDDDLIVGAYDGKIHVFNNTAGSGNTPDFDANFVAQDSGGDLVVPAVRSSPEFVDLTGDGLKDILTGDTNGQLLLYPNVGTAASPSFSGYSLVSAGGSAIDLPGDCRSRPFVCDWTGDGLIDVLVGDGEFITTTSREGHVYIYEGIPEPASLSLLAVGAAVLFRRRR